MDINFASIRALVCGSSQGIGRACAIELAQLGASVTLFSHNLVSLNAVKRTLLCTRTNTSSFNCRFSLPEQVNSVILAEVAAMAAWIF